MKFQKMTIPNRFGKRIFSNEETKTRKNGNSFDLQEKHRVKGISIHRERR